MFALPPSVRVLVGRQPVDMRRGIDGLFGLVQAVLQEPPFSGHLFVFFNRRRNRVKCLWWDRNGFAVHYKRLERGRFRLPFEPGAGGRVEVDASELLMVLDGFDLRNVKRVPRWVPPGAAETRAA